MPWYVLVTKPRSELKVTARLLHYGIEVCCPTRIERRQWSDRIKKVAVPLLPSMILVRIDAKDRNKVFNVSGVLRYLFYLGEPAIVRAEEVDVLKNISEKGHQVLTIKTIKPGDTIQVPGFGDLPQKGIVKQVSSNRCWVVLDQLGFVVTLQL
jgi:transcription antitermination factor NusG